MLKIKTVLKAIHACYPIAKKPRHYLIAGSLRDAQLSAEIDYGWKRDTSIHTYLDHNGEPVRILTGVRDFAGRRVLNKLYLGYGFYDRKDTMDILYVIRHRDITCIQHTTTIKEANAKKT